MTKLTNTQQTVLDYLAQGLNQASIARKLNIKPQSITWHINELIRLKYIAKIDHGSYIQVKKKRAG